MREWRRWIGSKDKRSIALAEKFFREAEMRVMPVPDSKFTEYLKLRSTTKYLWNIAWAEMEGEWSEKLDMPYKYNQKYDIDYNIMYAKLGYPQFKRYILEPPESKEIGGHCLIPNRDLLKEVLPHKYLKILDDYKQKD
jgi:UDP-N-acetyl-D-mannosaminuronate dehydrogenase